MERAHQFVIFYISACGWERRTRTRNWICSTLKNLPFAHCFWWVWCFLRQQKTDFVVKQKGHEEDSPKRIIKIMQKLQNLNKSPKQISGLFNWWEGNSKISGHGKNSGNGTAAIDWWSLVLSKHLAQFLLPPAVAIAASCCRSPLLGYPIIFSVCLALGPNKCKTAKLVCDK